MLSTSANPTVARRSQLQPPHSRFGLPAPELRCSRATAAVAVTSAQPGVGPAASPASAAEVIEDIAARLQVQHGVPTNKAGVNHDKDKRWPKVPMTLATAAPRLPWQRSREPADQIVLYRFSDILQFLDVITITAEQRAAGLVIVTVQSQSASLLPGWAPLPLHIVAILGWFIPFLHDFGANYDSVCKVRDALSVAEKDVAVVGNGGVSFMTSLEHNFGPLLKVWACVDQATKFFGAYIIMPTMLCTLFVLFRVS